MMKQMRIGLVQSLFSALAIVCATGFMATSASAQKANAHAEPIPQALYSDYKGVRLGMSPEEVRTKLGKPMQSDADQDYYVVSDNETVQLAYEAHKVIAISIDYVGGVGAPDYKTIVGPDVEVKADGSIHQLVMYDKLGFWVSYNRSAGNAPVVTITIQKTIR